MSGDFDPNSLPDDAFVRDLVQESLRGEQHAIGAALVRYWGLLNKIANDELDSDLRAKAGASDLVQQTMLEATQAIGKFRGTTEAEFRAWLKEILRNNVQDLRKRFRDAEMRDVGRERPLVQVDPAIGELASQGQSPSEEILRREKVQLLEAALCRLSVRQREIIRLRQKEDLSFGEIGDRMDCSEEAARKQWVRALEELGQILRGLDGGSSL